MMNRKRACAIVLVVLGFVVSPIAFLAQGKSGQLQAVSVLVTVASKTKDAPPDVPKDAVFVHQDNQTRKVLDWQPLPQNSSSLDLVVYVDDALDHSVGVPLLDAASFIRALPPNARIEVAYSQDGHPQIGQEFTTDREAAVKALHVPLGHSTGSYGLYSGLTELVQGWPSSAQRHAILLVSDGIDFMRGGGSQLLPGENPDLDGLTNLLRTDAITVFTIYGNGGGPLLHSPDAISVGQSCLQYLSDETGGEAFLGLGAPVSFSPYLKQISQELASQYLLTFEAVTANNKKPKLSRLQVGAEVPGIVIHAPAHVNVPAGPATQ